MRSRLFLGLMALSLITADLGAQRRVGILGSGRARPDRPAEKPKMAPGIHDNRYFIRSYAYSRFSVEQYPMLSYLQANGLVADGIPTNYVTFGDGTHLAFRVAPSLAVTTDFTSSFIGGPFGVGSMEFGARLKPWVSGRVLPFIDARYGWSYANSMSGPSGGIPFVALYSAVSPDNGIANGTGRGTALGVGLETRVSERVSLTSAVSHARFAMSGRNIDFQRFDYTMRTTRLTLGARYTYGRWYDAPRP
jgi:opacity protein-like surface antigen